MAILTGAVFSEAESRTSGRFSRRQTTSLCSVFPVFRTSEQPCIRVQQKAYISVLVVNNKGVAYTAVAPPSPTMGNCRFPSHGGYYVLSTSGEILFVYADSAAAGAAGNLTVRRGCLGTTASLTGVGDDDVLYVLCSVTLSSNTTGIVNFSYYELPSDPGVDYY